MKKTVVLYPGLGAGHLMPMIELAKVFVQHGVAVTVALVKPPSELGALDFPAVVACAAASNPSISFHVLPASSSLPATSGSGTGSGSSSDDAPSKKHYVLQMVDYLKTMNAPLRDFLRSLPAVDVLVIDMFCPDALDVAAELRLPVYYSYASCAGDLAVFLSLAFDQDTYTASIDAGDATLSLPGAPPFKASDLPREDDKDLEAGKAILQTLQRMAASDGILVNTFVELEMRAVRALRDGLCVPGRDTPPVYCIGPLVSGGGGEKEHECLRWLDSQPDRSVVFLCFGSLGTFSERQLKEVAVGLERSEQRFLWVVRTRRIVDEALPEPDLGALLPDGFLERTTGRGLVFKCWAPQVDVLRHRAAGAFMTHCGWNSTLEGITAGLPLLCWPMYAEQKMNKVFIVQEMKLGVEMRGYDGEVVAADQVETKIRWVMESEGGRALRERAAAAKDAAAKAIQEGGSSHADFVRFLQDLDNISSRS
ncbi:anthocyanidin 5,3-O-glucosyltransferase-like [Miscanthus floridulus]|uniref:anthocyanidin 5,3-O-glucosyltransferase-like n=1 Tax=Miscanthus floridulus TaxID=154761 RepID=UPI00345A33C7